MDWGWGFRRFTEKHMQSYINRLVQESRAFFQVFVLRNICNLVCLLMVWIGVKIVHNILVWNFWRVREFIFMASLSCLLTCL